MTYHWRRGDPVAERTERPEFTSRDVIVQVLAVVGSPYTNS